MGFSRSILLLSFFIIVVTIYFGQNRSSNEENLRSISILPRFFGKDLTSSIETEDSTIKSFQIPFDRSQIDELIKRLDATRFSSVQIEVDDRLVNRSTYGFPRETAEIIRDYWTKTFDWKTTVKELNEFEHFKTKIQGLNIHFVRVTDSSIDPIDKTAVLLLHGWPGSFLEYLDLTRLLNASTSTFHYDLIIPSLPGFGYSDAPVRSGLTIPQISMIMNSLMQRLGHRQYVVCGGDWGSFIGSAMAKMFPKQIRGYLTTMIEMETSLKSSFYMALAHWINPKLVFDDDELEFLGKPFHFFELIKFFWNEGGYLHLQATKPDTVGYALNDSPMGLATYILEKWSSWSNDRTTIDRSSNIGLERFTLDQLLTNVMLYWTTGSITSSMRIYFETISSTMPTKEEKTLLDGVVSKSVPVAVVNYRQEISYTPRFSAKGKYPNVKLWTLHKDGGHFAAMEKPKEFARDLQKFLLLL